MYVGCLYHADINKFLSLLIMTHHFLLMMILTCVECYCNNFLSYRTKWKICGRKTEIANEKVIYKYANINRNIFVFSHLLIH